MPVAPVQQRLALARPHEVVLLIRNVHPVAVYFVQPVLISKIVEPENIARVDRLDRARMQVWVVLGGLHDSRSERLNGRWLFPLLCYQSVSLGYAPVVGFRSNPVTL